MEENTRRNILICDDIATNRKTLANIFKNENFNIFEAENGEQAIDIYQDTKPDVVIMDVTMPKVDGIEALEKIKEIDSHAKVIMCSAIHDPYTINSALNKGALDFIIKPFSIEMVVKAITKVFN